MHFLTTGLKSTGGHPVRVKSAPVSPQRMAATGFAQRCRRARIARVPTHKGDGKQKGHWAAGELGGNDRAMSRPFHLFGR